MMSTTPPTSSSTASPESPQQNMEDNNSASQKKCSTPPSRCYSRDNKVAIIGFLVLCSFLLLPQSSSAAKRSSSSSSGGKGEKRVVCYYTNWSAYRQGPAKFLPDNINPYLCTHLVYAFGGLTSESGIKPFDKYQDIDKGGYTKFNGLKTYNKALKTLIAIGGWNEGSRRFSNLVADPESRKNFIKLAIRFLRQYQFDGLDLDWEYPASREGGVPEDKKNYAMFIKELREAFEEESKSTGRTRLLLTIAVPAGIEWIQKGFDIPTINRNIDFFNLLTYDYHASTEPNANHHAPLKARDGISDYDWKGQLNIEYTINHYLKEGADPDKLVVGLPTYGRSYNLFNVDSYDVDAPSSGPGTKGKYTKEPGYLSYYEICEGVKMGEWRVENAFSENQGPHAVKGDQWVGYDDTRIMGIKGKWVKDNGLGGIMFWSVDNDDFRGTCHGKPFPLIEAAKLAYLTGDAPAGASKKQQSSGSIKNNRFSTALANSGRKTTTSTTPLPPKTTTGAASTKRRNKKGQNKKKATTTSTTTTTTTSNPLSTPEPPTTPDPGVDFECKDDGFFPHPRECKKYFWCLEAPGLGLVAHHFTCPAGLFFNKNTDSCDYARNVACKDKKAGDVVTTKPTTSTTTERPTTTTTTTPEPDPEEEYDDDEEEEEEEEVVVPLPKPKPSYTTLNRGGGSSSSSKSKTTPPRSPSKGEENNGRSVKEINDIKDLLKLIRKLGGVEELEKYLDENPSVAAAIEEYDEGEEEIIPKAKGKTSTFSRNRFTPSASSSTTSSSIAKQRFSSFSPKYTLIQRGRAASTTTTTPAPTPTVEDEEVEEEDEEAAIVPSASPKTASTTSKYVTLSRKTDAPTEKPSSTETSVVIRFSRDDKLLDELLLEDKQTDQVGGRRVVGVGSGEADRDGYVTISRPYARVYGNSAPATTTPKSSLISGSSSDNLRYVAPLSKSRSSGGAKETLKAEAELDEEASEEYESDEGETTTTGKASPTTAKPPTTTTPTQTSNRPKLRIPTRRVSDNKSFSGRGVGSPTTTKPEGKITLSAGNRRALFQNRIRSTTTSTGESSLRDNNVDSNGAAQTANEESITPPVDILSSELSKRGPDDNEVKRLRGSSSSRSRSLNNPENSIKTSTSAPRKSEGARNKSRFRSTTTTTEQYSTTGPHYSTSSPIVFRRRLKSKTTFIPSTTTTTTTTTSTTRQPTTLKPREEEEAEYYYYYYDEDEELPYNSPVVGAAKAQFQQPHRLYRGDDSASPFGLRSETFTPSTSTQQLQHHQQLVAVGGSSTKGSKGSTTIGTTPTTTPTPTPSTSSSTRESEESRGFSKRNLAVGVPPPQSPLQSSSSSSMHKWSSRAVVPLSEKIKLNKVDGSVECLDKGIFPHPISCRQFVHCVPNETKDGGLRAFVYACPTQLTFDPVGGMCNYDEFANSRTLKDGNACIE